MAERLLAYLVTQKVVPVPDVDAVIARLREVMAPINIPIGLHPTSASDGHEIGKGFVLGIDDVAIVVLFAPRRLPAETYAQALSLNRTWPEAGPALAAGTGHVVIGTAAEVTTHGMAMNAAAYVSFVASVLIEMIPSVGVVWTNGEVVRNAEGFHADTMGLLERKMPVMNWVGFWILTAAPSAAGLPQVVLMTSGLLPFIGREIEWMPSTQPLPALFERLIGTCTYLIENGPVIGDGETLGQTAEEKIRARHVAQGQRPGIPVLQLTEESSLAPRPGAAGLPWGASATAGRPASPWDGARTVPELPPSWSETALPRSFGRKRS